MATVKDTILYITEPRSPIRTVAAHTKTKRRSRLSDGMEHPVTIRRVKPEKPVSKEEPNEQRFKEYCWPIGEG